MKMRVSVYVFVKSKAGWIEGFFQGTISSPCKYDVDQTIEFPEIGNSIDEENRVRVLHVNHKYVSAKNSTHPEIFCVIESDLDEILVGTDKEQMEKEIAIELRNWTEESLPALRNVMTDFYCEGFKEVLNKKPDHYDEIPGATLK